jgi:heme/copper-type cytochrome/quinol oxidase subunit 4
MQDMPQSGMQPQSQVVVKPHRGGAILALGIIGIVLCFITAIIAWVMGSGDLKEMKEGKRDRSGEQLTKAGMICGIIGVCLAVLGILWWIIAVVIIGIPFLGALSSLH